MKKEKKKEEKSKVLFKHIVVGFRGEVGSCVYEFLHNSKNTISVRGIDLNANECLNDIQKVGTKICFLLHICIPYSKKFVKIAQQYIKNYNPDCTIVYSTVPPGTCRKIGKKVIHSPIEGIHPNLSLGFKEFTRFLGFQADIDTELFNTYNDIIDFFKLNDLKVYVVDGPETTELAKMLSTTRYGVYLMFCDEMNRLCKKFGVNYTETVVAYQHAYNNFYKKIGLPKYCQPILTPPDGHCGGHCIVQNAQAMVKHNMDEPMLKKLSKFNDLPLHLKIYSWIVKLLGGK